MTAHAAGVRTRLAIEDVCDEIKEILLAKNAAYGNSATDPIRIFSHADPREQLLVRIDDKLSRIARGGELGEDVVLDLIGYLVLLRVSERLDAHVNDWPDPALAIELAHETHQAFHQALHRELFPDDAPASNAGAVEIQLARGPGVKTVIDG